MKAIHIAYIPRELYSKLFYVGAKLLVTQYNGQVIFGQVTRFDEDNDDICTYWDDNLMFRCNPSYSNIMLCFDKCKLMQKIYDGVPGCFKLNLTDKKEE